MGWAALIGVDDPGLALSTMAKRDADRLLSTFTSPDGDKRVLIVQRPDNAYSFRYQCSVNEMPGDWGPPGPYCGIYDSEQTAEQEAFHRLPWLAHRRPH